MVDNSFVIRRAETWKKFSVQDTGAIQVINDRREHLVRLALKADVPIDIAERLTWNDDVRALRRLFMVITSHLKVYTLADGAAAYVRQGDG